MRNTMKCPKCGSTEITRIPGNVGVHGTGSNVSIGITIFNAIKVTRFLCGQCGFSEEWVEGKDNIAKIVDKYKQ